MPFRSINPAADSGQRRGQAALPDATIGANSPASLRARGRMNGTSDDHRQDRKAALAVPAPAKRHESFNLAEEVAMNSPRLGLSEPPISSGGGSFRERMKKTSGFLRKLRGDSSSSSSSSGGASTNQTASVKPQARRVSVSTKTSSAAVGLNAQPQSSATIARRESQTSFASEGASSLAHSTYSVSSGPTLRLNAHFGQRDDFPVPSIPSKYARSASASASTTDVQQAPLLDPSLRHLTPSPRARRSSRVGAAASMEAAARDHNGLDVVLPQRSSSQTIAHVPRASNGSVGDVRIVIREWEHAMDDALKDAACDLERKTEFTPKAAWGPSPTLPVLDLSRYRERSGSFMDEGDAEERARQIKSGARVEGTSSSLPSTPMMKSSGLRPALGSGVPSGTAQRAATYDYTGNGSIKTKTGQAEADSAVTPEATGLGIIKHSPRAEPCASSNSIQQSADSKLWQVTDASSTLAKDCSLATSSERWSNDAFNQLHGQRADSPGDSVQTPRSSTRNSSDSTRQPYSARSSHVRVGNSGASLASARSFETAAESAVPTSADPTRLATVDSHLEQQQQQVVSQLSVDADQTGLPLARTSSDDQFEDMGDPEQSIRLVTSTENGLGRRTYNGDEVTTLVDAEVISISPGLLEQGGRSMLQSAKGQVQPALETISEASHRRGGRASPQPPGGLSLQRERVPSRGPSPSLSLLSRDPISSSLSHTHTVRALPAGSVSADVLSLNEDERALDSGDLKMSREERGAELASKCWAEDPVFLKKEKIAEWLGGIGLANKAARRAYFERFDFDGLRVDVAFRRLCEKLFLRAETQQVDRILRAFSERYFECNEDSVFGSADEVHSVVFSLLLLNTDLHIADIQDRMTRSQFIRNTMSAIAESRQIEMSAAGLASGNDSRSSLNTVSNVEHNEQSSQLHGASPSLGSLKTARGRVNRSASTRSRASSSIRQQDFSSAISEAPSSPRLSMATLPPGITVSGAPPRRGDIDLESLLREIYTAIKSERVLLPDNRDLKSPGGLPPSTTRRRGPADRVNALKRGSIRGIQSLLGGPATAAMGMGSDTNSLDPSAGSFTSRSAPDPWGAFASPVPAHSAGQATQPNTATIGFASTLTQTIIREAQEDEDARSLNSLLDEPDDDKLALMGPPWAKEGTLTRKHYWEAPGKRARDKSWAEVFVVVQRGRLSMFKFCDTSSRSKQAQAPSAKSSGRAMGGGNWLSNATTLGEVNLAHTLANILPSPGYNRERPHVFALTLPGGAVYFFQAGHEELVQEWVQTCNYWAARQSKEPLSGGVSNMEYGWNKILPHENFEELDGADDDDDGDSALFGPSNSNAGSVTTVPDASIYNGSSSALHKPTAAAADSRSLRSARSARSTRSRTGTAFYQNLRDVGFLYSASGGSGGSSTLVSPAASMLGTATEAVHRNERILINDWKAPAMPTVASTLKEEDQLDHCLRHMQILENDLTLHNELRHPMLQLYSPRDQNHAKALANWERKSNHLLQELVKYQCYVDSLKNSVKLRADQRGKKEVEGMMRRADEEMAKVKEAEEGGPVLLLDK